MRRIAAIAALLVVVVVVAIAGGGLAGSSGDPYTVRAIFDDASFAATGEDVRIAGADVGSITALGVTADNRAAVTMTITDSRFAPFHADASCAIRPQSLIGEEYVDCQPGSAGTPALARIPAGSHGAGSYLLPVTQTSSPIDFDVVQDISTEPVRESLSVILDELGTGLAARGSDLNAVIHRADPALGETDQVLKILAGQNRTLAQLATNSDAVLGPLARVRSQITDFIAQADTTSVASAARATDIAATFHLLPAFLERLRPLLSDLGSLADQGTPLMTELGSSASALGQQFANLTPFAAAARTSLIDLGATAQRSEPSLVATLPLARRLLALGTDGRPAASNLAKLTSSLDSTGAIAQLMALLYNGATAANGFDALGHYVRDEPIVSTCTNYATTPVPGCSSNFAGAGRSATVRHASAASRRGAAIVSAALRSAAAGRATTPPLHGLLSYLLGKTS